MDALIGPVMTQAAIIFPAWIDPVLIQIGPIAIRWYSLGYIVGILAGWWLAKRMVQNDRLWGAPSPIQPIDIDDFLLWAVIGIVLGGRLGFVLFYDTAAFIENPLRILQVWQGGMSFHGGLIGTTIAMLIFARSRGIDPWRFFDVIGAVAPIGIGLVRIANFINAELWGRQSDVSWAMIFPTDPLQVPRHPSQLYEAALEGLILFLVLRFAVARLKTLSRPRMTTGIFIGGYGLGRTAVEFFRQPDPFIGNGGFLFDTGWVTMGMMLSTPMIILGVILIATSGNKPAEKTA
ncbi:MAG: prolipoprotein diacylglyceryl transferase [Pseudomonadota bacterium]